MTGSIVSGQIISRTGRYKFFPIIGVGAARAGARSRLGQSASTPRLVDDAGHGAVFGLGLGVNMQPLIAGRAERRAAADMGVATSSATFFRQMGGTLGTAVFLSILFSTVGDNIAAAFRAAPATPEFQAALDDPRCSSDPANAGAATAVLQRRRAADRRAERLSFLPAGRTAGPAVPGRVLGLDGPGVPRGRLLLALVVVGFLPEVELRTSSGLEARARTPRGPCGRRGG